MKHFADLRPTQYGRRAYLGRSASILIAGLGALLADVSTGLGQQVKARPSRSPKHLRMQSVLYDAERLAHGKPDVSGQAVAAAQLQKHLADRHIKLRNDDKVHVEIVGPAGANAIDPAVIRPMGGEITNRWRHRVDAWVPIRQLSNVAGALPPGYFMERAEVNCYDDVVGEGPAMINSDSYRDGGSNGAGRVIAVIDGGYQGLTAARNNGDAPNATNINYTSNSFEASADSPHGTGCVESAFDHCPGATWRLYKIDSLTDMGTAVDDCIANGVNVISHSLSRYNTGWADNTGPACTAAIDAANNGILFFTSCGNRAQQHWQGSFNAGSDSDDLHDFAPGDETIDLTINNGGGGTFYLQWNTSGGTFDYELILYDSDLTTVLASSTNGGNSFESFSWTNQWSSRTVHIVVERYSGGTTEFEIFFHASGGSGNFQYQTAAGSNTSPSNTSNSYPNVIANGAVGQSLHNSPTGSTGIIQAYSSQGPSNSGMTLPDICGPTNTLNFTYGTFGGTSCATPNNAGAACAFWSADPQLSASAVRWLMFEQADLFRDWGAAGNDNIYGRGGSTLLDFAANTLWVARSYGNVANARSAPFNTTQAAYDNAVGGGRLLIFPGGSYPETLTAVGTKSVSVQTVVNAANVGF